MMTSAHMYVAFLLQQENADKERSSMVLITQHDANKQAEATGQHQHQISDRLQNFAYGNTASTPPEPPPQNTDSLVNTTTVPT
jgi:hypothetical protein